MVDSRGFEVEDCHGDPPARGLNSAADNRATGPPGRALQLKFSNKISQPVFTGVPIKGEDGPLKLALVDCRLGEVVKNGPKASTKVKLVVLEADFDGNEGDSWSYAEFNRKIVIKEGNKHVLVGDLVLVLKEGMVDVYGINFPHTKYWQQKHEYRLGAIAEDECIGPAVTESFLLKDRRLDNNKKHCPLTLDDPVYLLEGIAKGGTFHQRLRGEKINKVRDLLIKLNTNPQKLQEVLGKRFPARAWDVIVSQNEKCILDGRLYMYSSSGTRRRADVVFNTVGKVIGLLLNGQFVSHNMLSEDKKVEAVNLVGSAFQQWDKVVPMGDEASLVDKSLETSSIIWPPKSPIKESPCDTILISPKLDEHCLSQLAVSFRNKASVSDDSSGVAETICSQKSPIMDSSSSKIVKRDSPQPVVSFEAEPLPFDATVVQSPIAISSSDMTAYPNIDILDFPQPPFYYMENMPICDSLWDMNYYNDYEWWYDNHMDHWQERPLSFSGFSSGIIDNPQSNEYEAPSLQERNAARIGGNGEF